jgi:hypothetical protein
VRAAHLARDGDLSRWSGEGVEPGDVLRTGNVWADTLTPVPLTWGLLE